MLGWAYIHTCTVDCCCLVPETDELRQTSPGQPLPPLVGRGSGGPVRLEIEASEETDQQ